MKPVNMILFEREEVDKILAILNLSVENDKIINEAKEPITCYACGEEISPQRLGNAMPGSKMYFCDKTPCFAIYLSEKEHV